MLTAQLPKISIVDGHNQALFFWLKAKNAHNFEPATLVHIDAHADMGSGAPSEEAALRKFSWLNLTSINDYKYADGCLSVENHTSVAVHLGVLDRVYWFDPRKDHAVIYGANSGLKTKIKDDKIVWEEKRCPAHENRPFAEVLVEIAANKKPIILDVDLDAFLCVNDPINMKMPEAVARHTLSIRNTIGAVPREQVKAITIAKSLNPSQWTPVDKVFEFLTLTMGILRETGLAEIPASSSRLAEFMAFPSEPDFDCRSTARPIGFHKS